MRLLLDSHVVLWWDKDLTRLTDAQCNAISDSDSEVFVSAATAWELGIKRSTGKLLLADSIQALAQRFGFTELAITIHMVSWRLRYRCFTKTHSTGCWWRRRLWRGWCW